MRGSKRKGEKRDVYAGICETSEGDGGFGGVRRRLVVSRLRRRHRANVAEIKSLTLSTDVTTVASAARERPDAVHPTSPESQ